ncbi:MAG: ABC transporter substrate-binding protein [Patescibacteria group bacterium]
MVFGIAKKKIPSWAQLKYVGHVLNFQERWIIDMCLGVIILASIFMGAFLYFNNTELVPSLGGGYTEALVGYPERINPILAQTNDVDMDLSALIYSGLFSFNEKQELQPDLVSNYEISEDLKTYTFYLKQDVKWHDGENLMADDVIFTVNSIQDKLFQSPLESSLRGVQAEKISDYAFKLTLKEVFSPFLSTLTFGILPKHVWYDISQVTSQNIFLTEYNLQPIGSGPYMFDSLVKDKQGNIKSYQLTVFSDYYNNKPNIEKLNFIFYADMFSAMDALERKQVDGLFAVPIENKEDVLKKNRQVNINNLRLPQYTAIFFNQDNSKVLKRPKVREALALGVDRDDIINQVLQGEGIPIYTPIIPGYLGYNTEVNKHDYNTDQAKQLLEDDGWKMVDGENYRQKDDMVLEFTISTVDQSEYLAALEELKNSWQAMGFKININTYAAQDIREQIINDRNYEALLFGEIMGTDPDPYAFWHSSQQEYPGLALAIFYQKDIDGLLEDARKTTDAEQRRLRYFHFQNVLAEEIPAIFLYSPNYTYVVNKKIQGIELENVPLPSGRFSEITNWYIKTERIRKSKEQ